MNNHAEIILTKIQGLEKEINKLKGELKSVQQHCEHQFENTALFKTCIKCKYVEPLYY
ncbi:serine protease [Scopulibacillus cellulosilyticus]|uniref:Serine protease n=1 Tax=Scopulibacillus cellulosilyticus TaxID=2665665 RepID=A0ABW2PX82_9BACL